MSIKQEIKKAYVNANYESQREFAQAIGMKPDKYCRKMKRPDTLTLPELHAIAVKAGMTAEDIGKLIKDWRQV